MKSFSALSAAGRRAACLPGRRLFACEDGRRLYAPVAAARPRDRHTRASLGVVDLEARPGPAAAHERRSHTAGLAAVSGRCLWRVCGWLAMVCFRFACYTGGVRGCG